MFAERLAGWFLGGSPKDDHREEYRTWFDPSALSAVSWTALFLLAGWLFVALAADASRSKGILIAGAIAAAAAVLGFLFGIPRSLPPPPAAVAGADKPTTAATTPPIAGLEQVADWLTKIILGAGLTQLGAIKGFIVKLAHFIAACVCTTDCAPQRAQVAFVFGLAVIGYFSAFGFLGGYLTTRLLLARLLRKADKTVEDIAREVGQAKGERIGKERTLTAVQNDITALIKNATQVHFAAAVNPNDQQAVQQAETWQPGGEPTVADDPQKGRFGGKAEASSRRLEATVSGSRSTSSELFRIDLKVASTDPAKSPLTGPVKFFLHDTFDPDSYVVVADGTTATLSNLVAWGAFTVGVICDGGSTKLELDLSTIPDAPAKFRER